MIGMETHRRLSAECFNTVWELLEKPDRSTDEDRLMREMAHASLFHWLKRDDCTAKNLSIGLWQIARVHAVLGNGDTSASYAAECLAASMELPAFYQAYAHEAATRAESIRGNSGAARRHLDRAMALAAEVTDPSAREMIDRDLGELAGSPSAL